MKNTIILTISRLYEKGIMFFFFMSLARKFGSESFGEFSYYFTIASILFVFFDVGGEFYQIREFTRGETIRKYQTLFLLKTSIAFLALLGCILTKQPVGLLILIGSFYLDSLISIFKSSFYKNNMYANETVLTFFEKSMLAILILLNVLIVDSLLFMYVSLVFGKIIYLMFANIKYYGIKYVGKSFFLFDFSFFRKYLYSSWSYVVHALLVIIFVQIDVVMLKNMGVSFGKIGIYTAAVKIYFTVIIFADILFKQYYPKIAKLVNGNKNEDLRQFLIRIQSLNIYVSIGIALLTMLFSQEVIFVAFGDKFYESSKILILLSIVIVFRFSMYTYTAVLSSSSLNYIKLFTSLSCVFINVVLNYFLIPHYGVYGALVATIVTEFSLVTFYKISSYKIVFTNYLTIKEMVALVFPIALSAYLFNHPVELKYKIVFPIILIPVLFFSRSNIQKVLSF